MKKLMIAAAIVCAAAMSQAVTYEWSIAVSEGGGEYYAFGGEESGLYTGAAYLFYTTDNEAIWSAVVDGGQSLATYAAANGGQQVSMVGGGFSTTYTTEEDLGTLNVVLVADDGKGHILVDAVNSGDWEYTMGTGGVPLYGNWLSDPQYSLADKGPFDEYGSWYTTAAVPEPTSGLLLLLGVAGLALRRRRA